MDIGCAACLDVYYCEDSAKACAVVFQLTAKQEVVSTYCSTVRSIEAYKPGQFYKRELPCLMSVYETIKEGIGLLIVDGYVHLGRGRGLGLHLFEALNGQIPVIGVAKTQFKYAGKHMQVLRGKSKKPLYISSIGLDLYQAADIVRNLQGDARIPHVLKQVDKLTRARDESPAQTRS